MGLTNSVKRFFGPKPELCPLCKNDSLVPWKFRIHKGNVISNNPQEVIVGIRCEKCPYTAVFKPMAVFAVYKAHLKSSDDKIISDMLVKAIERCVIDHRKDVIPKEIWEIVTPKIKKRLANYRAKECTKPPLNTPEYWEQEYNLICYEAYGKCVWGFDQSVRKNEIVIARTFALEGDRERQVHYPNINAELWEGATIKAFVIRKDAYNEENLIRILIPLKI